MVAIPDRTRYTGQHISLSAARPIGNSARSPRVAQYRRNVKLQRVMVNRVSAAEPSFIRRLRKNACQGDARARPAGAAWGVGVP